MAEGHTCARVLVAGGVAFVRAPSSPILGRIVCAPEGQVIRARVLSMGVIVDDDTNMMAEALALAQRAAGRTSPNPLVGAVVVADGRVVGRGFHHRAGEAHAEALALLDARDRARGATLYTTLEPCAHA